MDPGMRPANPNPATHKNCLGRAIYWWTGRIFWKGYHHTLDEADVYDVLPQDSTVKLSNDLGREWETELYRWKTGGQPSLVAAMWRCYGIQMLAFVLLVLLEETLRIGQAVLMGELIGLFERDPGSDLRVTDAYIYAGAICLVFIISIFLDHDYFHCGYRMRVAVTSLIYRKIMKLPHENLNSATTETIMNLISREVDVFPMVLMPSIYLVIAPLQTFGVCYLLWTWLDLGAVSIAGVSVIFLLIPLQILMAKLSRILRQRTELFLGHRLKKLQLIINGIREVKMACWEKFCEKLLLSAREDEHAFVRRLLSLQGFHSALTLTGGKLVMFVTFILYIVFGNGISARQIFTAMGLCEILRISVSILLPSGCLYLGEALATIQKVQAFLLLEDQGYLSTMKSGAPELQNNIAVQFWEYFAATEKKMAAPLVLNEVDISIEKGKLYSVVGPPDSGKSALLLAIAGELCHHRGGVQHTGKLAYVSKDGWVFPGTVRDNILFGAEYVRYRYTQILQACALSKIVESFSHGDMTIVGERGLMLDDSLQAKIALARAVYQNADIYLIDEVLRIMEAKTAMHVFKKCICGLLKSKTRILVTDSIHHVRAGNEVIVMNNGRIVHHGCYDDLQNVGVNFTTFLTSRTHKHVDLATLSHAVSQTTIADMPGGGSLSHTATMEEFRDRLIGTLDAIQRDYKDPGDSLIIGDNVIGSGLSPSRDIYWQYFVTGGGLLGILAFIVLTILEQGSFVLCEWWLAYWAEITRRNLSIDSSHINSSQPIKWLLAEDFYIYTSLTFGTVFIGFLQAMCFFWIAGCVATILHDQGIDSLMQAPLSFFDSNYIGGLLSRFSRDVSVVDFMAAPYLDCIQSMSLLVTTVLIVGSVNYWLFILVVPVSVIFMCARNYFMQTTHDVERIELISKSAVSSHIASTMEGICSIRTYGVQERFLHNFDVFQDRSTAASYLHLAANRWFGMRVDVLGLLVVAGVAFSSIIVVQYKEMNIAASLIGLSLFYSINLINVLQPAVRKSAAVHFKMGSVERLMQCYQIVPETDIISNPHFHPPTSWPQYGIITFEGVSLTYSPKGPNILKNLWCCVRAEEKVGILFKSPVEQKAFLSVLFRFVDITGIVRIDGIDTMNVSAEVFREKFTIIPQSPTLLLGTVRQNLDPMSRCTDVQLWKALEEVHLAAIVETLPQKLYTDISVIADNVTIGQRQLFSLARALLRQTKFLIYEEPLTTMNISCNTIIQMALRSKFNHCTVIHIAHLPDSVIDSDRIMIFSEGRIQEIDSPHLLLQNNNGKLYKMVSELGESVLRNLKRIAQDKYENKPYVAPPINPSDFAEANSDFTTNRNPSNLNVIPSFHSTRLVGVLNQLPTNRFSTNRL